VIWTVLALVVSTTTGLALIKTLWPIGKSEGSDWLLQFSLACGFGLGATSLVLFLVLAAKGSAGSTIEILAESVLLLGLLAVSYLRRNAPVGQNVECRTPESRISFLWGSALAIAFAFTFLSFILVSRRAPHGSWDGWSIWNLHARFLFRGGSQFWRDTFSPLLYYYKPDYPLLIPASIARLWTYTNHETLFAPALVAEVFTFALPLLTTSAVARLRGGKQGILAGLLLLGTPAFVDLGASQCADVAVGFFFLATLALFCLDDCMGHNRGHIALAGVAAGMGAWTKNEGLMLLLIVLAVRIALSFRTQGLRVLVRQHAPFVAGLTPVILPILYFKRLVPTNDMVAGQGLHATLARLLSLSRYKITGKAFLHETLFFGGWFASIILVLAFYALLVGLNDNTKLRKTVTAQLLAIAVAAAGYFFVYIVTPNDVAWQLKWSLERVFMQLWPATIFSLFLLLRTPEEAVEGENEVDPGEKTSGIKITSTVPEVASS
jgi:hypothetical protein